jgi:hypothetical protein
MPSALQNAVAVNLLDNVNVGVQNGATFALPIKPGQFAWQTVFGTAPGSITVNIQISNDGTNWTTVDTSTNVNGEVRQISSLTALFVRATISAVAGGTTATVVVIYKGANAYPITGIAFGQLLFTSVKQNGNIGAGLTEVAGFDLPANTLINNGDALVIESWAFLANNANNKLTLTGVGGASVASRSGVPDTNLPRLHRCRIVRTGNLLAQGYGGVDTQGQGTLINLVNLTVQDWRTVLRISFSAQGTADNDIIHRGTQIWYVPVTGTYVGL